MISESRKLAYLRALFFEHDVEIRRKDHLWTGTSSQKRNLSHCDDTSSNRQYAGYAAEKD